MYYLHVYVVHCIVHTVNYARAKWINKIDLFLILQGLHRGEIIRKKMTDMVVEIQGKPAKKLKPWYLNKYNT